jgi:competence CoiA-like predicted nuclease
MVLLYCAYDTVSNDYVLIDDVNVNNKLSSYTCMNCNSIVIAKMGNIKEHHFAHKFKSNCNANINYQRI